MNISKDDLLWLAGYLEGEGSFAKGGNRNSDGSNSSIQIQVSSIDRDVIDRVASLFDTSVYEVKNYEYEKSFKGPRQQQYRTAIHGMRAVEWMLELAPLLSSRRREQIKDALMNYAKLSRLLEK